MYSDESIRRSNIVFVGNKKVSSAFIPALARRLNEQFLAKALKWKFAEGVDFNASIGNQRNQ
jgi:hypothetical protein